MKYYGSYMDRQGISPESHETLLKLERSAKKKAVRWAKPLTLAVCCVLVLGLGMWKFIPGAASTAQNPVFRPVEGEVQKGTYLPERLGEPAQTDEPSTKMMPMVPYINYQSVDVSMDVAASIALMEGSFRVELTREDILKLFWGETARPGGDAPVTPEHPQGEEALPWTLFWEGYELDGWVIYDGSGSMYWLMIVGNHPDGYSFELELSPGRLPPSCLAEPGLETTDVLGATVTGWSRAYDRNGDGVTDHICGAEFMAGDVGVRFENVGSPFGEEDPQTLMAGAAQFNALFIRQTLSGDGGLYVDHLLRTDDVPEWREAEFASLSQARQEAEFAPYLPAEDIPGYGEFYGRLTYQEGNENTLFVRWSRNYDDVEVCVYRPEGNYNWFPPVDVTVPESYDTRLYEIPWYDSVPEEYQENFYMAHFRAEDMSFAVVEARGTEKDTGGTAYRFGVLHPDGTMVHYTCSGITAGQVWELVEPTLQG